MSEEKKISVAVLGGGVSGMATAYELGKRCKTLGVKLECTLLERDPILGGKIATEQVDGFIVEGGPDSFITQKPEGLALCRELGLEEQLMPTNATERPFSVLIKGKLVPFPTGFRLTIPKSMKALVTAKLISWPGKFRMMKELFVRPRTDPGDESLGDFVERRFGKEVVDKIADPLMAGIFVSDAYRLSMLSTFPMFVMMEKKYGSLTKAFKQHRSAKLPFPSVFATLKGGMMGLINTLQKETPGEVLCGTGAHKIDRRKDGFTVRFADDRPALEVDAVVMAIPAFDAARLVCDFHPRLAEMLGAIRYVSTATASMAFPRKVLDQVRSAGDFGFIIPNAEKRKILACTFSSSKFSLRAPEDSMLLRAFVGGEDKEEQVGLADDELLEVALRELHDIVGIKEKPFMHRVYRWQNGNPQYDVGHLDRMDVMDALAAETKGLYLTGNAFRENGIPGCIKSARNTIDRLCKDFHLG